ncbi:MAG: MBL fold metallo-hydrolase [Clostridia bacterium]|nr:MBL fold metallo-hydrolase [Clostridia bacterium]NLS84805.1 MBL fold metallo-hydrolase [Oscillospiraceae bacterium]
MAKFTTLYSGSSGNCAYISSGEGYLLVDMGKSCRTTVEGLKTLGAPISNLQGVLVTHEHSDHVGGLNVFLKKYKVPVYSSADTLDFLYTNRLVPESAELIDIDGRTEHIGDFSVQSFETSHDSAACRGYRIETPEGKAAAIATDLGYVSDEVLANLLLADFVSLEANYDLDMLMHGSYPYYLKTRIASSRGHLCNEECAETIVKLMQNGCKKFALCHVSKENNTPETVYSTVMRTLAKNGFVPEKDCLVQVAERYAVSPIIEF